MDKLMNSNGFSNIITGYVNRIDLGQMISNLANNPEIKALNNTINKIHPELKGLDPITPEEIEKFKDKDNNIDFESLKKYNLNKLGCQNTKDLVDKYGNIALNSPLFNVFENEFQKIDENANKFYEENKDKINEDEFNNIIDEVLNEKINNNSK